MAGDASDARERALSLWLTLSGLPEVGPRTALELLEHFGGIEAVFSAAPGALEKALAGRNAAVRAILAGPDAAVHAPVFEWLAHAGQHLLTWKDADYPGLLREIPDPPLVLYVLGDRGLLACRQFAIVGARNPTPGGRENAEAFARSLAGAGLVITSGLALGVDGAAHRGALAAGGRTVAVCGTGLDRVYPARHRELAHAIAGQGALVSEFPLGTPPRAGNFPVRNRLISGLALGTLVVEAALQSGSLITARLALEQGREVFAIPGSIHSPLARGCHRLIREGAKLVETAQDILEELGALAPLAPPAARAPPAELAPNMSRLLENLGYDPVSVDTLVERSGLTPDAVSSMLLHMELAGLIKACPGGKYLRTS
jgi:DNA processing protein